MKRKIKRKIEKIEEEYLCDKCHEILKNSYFNGYIDYTCEICETMLCKDCGPINNYYVFLGYTIEGYDDEIEHNFCPNCIQKHNLKPLLEMGKYIKETIDSNKKELDRIHNDIDSIIKLNKREINDKSN